MREPKYEKWAKQIVHLLEKHADKAERLEFVVSVVKNATTQIEQEARQAVEREKEALQRAYSKEVKRLQDLNRHVCFGELYKDISKIKKLTRQLEKTYLKGL